MQYIILFFGVIGLLSFLSWRFPEQQKRVARQRRAEDHGQDAGDRHGH